MNRVETRSDQSQSKIGGGFGTLMLIGAHVVSISHSMSHRLAGKRQDKAISSREGNSIAATCTCRPPFRLKLDLQNWSVLVAVVVSCCWIESHLRQRRRSGSSRRSISHEFSVRRGPDSAGSRHLSRGHHDWLHRPTGKS